MELRVWKVRERVKFFSRSRAPYRYLIRVLEHEFYLRLSTFQPSFTSRAKLIQPDVEITGKHCQQFLTLNFFEVFNFLFREPFLLLFPPGSGFFLYCFSSLQCCFQLFPQAKSLLLLLLSDFSIVLTHFSQTFFWTRFWNFVFFFISTNLAKQREALFLESCQPFFLLCSSFRSQVYLLCLDVLYSRLSSHFLYLNQYLIKN